MNLKIDAPAAVRAGEEINVNALQDYLHTQKILPAAVLDVRQFPGGYSNLTYLLKTQDQQEYVLRRPPFGAEHIKGGHDMEREFRVLTMIQQAGFTKIPKPIDLCTDLQVMNCPFYIMERVPGVILRAQSDNARALPAAALRTTSEALVDTLADLHKIDIYKTGLNQIGKPEGYIRRQVEGWYKRYLASQTDDLPAMEQLYNWLNASMPAEHAPTLIHNDFKYDNLVLNPENLSEVRAVLDWEMCTVGDPLMDVGTALSYWSEAGDGAFEQSFNLTCLPGNLSRQEFAQRYAQQSGRDVSGILYYYVFGLFKNTVVMQQIYARWKKGLTRDERFGRLLVGIQSLSDTARKAIDRGTM
ncbi:phosphotransferase [Arundinibacter roseus]|uniref:Phosphotransferase family protein n=1 Tax=Arundinibacter roseus TaxID=2070510 RepID=A0A4R4KLY4_9BACT|nr:phosphotransferase [Arundinibacter roseus]TDB68983.1 phosphotransferase family protein [Arundinibacter roseus]